MVEGENMEEKQKKHGKKIIVVGLLLFIVILGSTYAWLTLSIRSDKKNTIVAGTLSLVLEEDEGIQILKEEAIPLTKETALTKENNIYHFELKNDGNIDSEYKVYLEIENEGEDTVIPNQFIRYMLTKNDVVGDDLLLSEALKESTDGDNKNKIILDSSNFDSSAKVLKPESSNTYSLRLWIDEEATNEIANKTFSAKIKVVATQTGIE